MILSISCSTPGGSSNGGSGGGGGTTPPAVISNVTGLTATPANGKVTLNWTDPGDADFDHVEVTSSPVTSTYTVLNGTSTKEITGLTNGTAYTFTVKSVDTSGNKSSGESVTSTPVVVILKLNFEYGEDITGNYSNIYVVWLENTSSNFIQNIAVCERLVNDYVLQGIALPYWKMNKYPSSKTEADTISGATKARQDFTVTFALKNPSIKQFRIYFEIDRSYESNEWFSDQPAILYYVDVDLNTSVKSYDLNFQGWTPNDKTTNPNSLSPMNQGEIQSEKRYITHTKNGTAFGPQDLTKSATKMVKKITLTIQ